MKHGLSKAIGGALLLAVICAAQTPAPKKPSLNGRYWTEQTLDTKLGFVEGYTDALKLAETMPFVALAINDCSETPKARGELLSALVLMWPNGATMGDAIKALDRLYAEPENLTLTISQALRVVSMKFRSDKPEDIDAELRRLRVASKQPDAAK